MSKRKSNNHWFVCPYCGYHGDKDTLIEQLYAIKLKTEDYCVECPHCLGESLKTE